MTECVKLLRKSCIVLMIRNLHLIGIKQGYIPMLSLLISRNQSYTRSDKMSSRVREANSDIPDKYFIRWSNAFRTPPPTEDDENQQMKDWDETKGRSKENNEKADVISNLLVSDERM
ncbi:hypothetical protein CAPTEDRAFT_198358 [Capitella teleta]|uniref:Uncharacterized protein n=1 Tax=Capitella teleta TaxID=283909 RepID=R7UB00_CAPTE|nr:hypothetical protein CAPTEDRAFT_198358 [Capitella teleta]|eukprot:ELU03169.1 hypothetical protein CAPTEDRAFT_198358 [Capitella teleta]